MRKKRNKTVQGIWRAGTTQGEEGIIQGLDSRSIAEYDFKSLSKKPRLMKVAARHLETHLSIFSNRKNISPPKWLIHLDGREDLPKEIKNVIREAFPEGVPQRKNN